MSLFQSETISVDKDFDGSTFLKINVTNRPVNVLTRQVLQELNGALATLEKHPDLPALILRSGKSSGFMAGADLREFLQIQTSAEAECLSAEGQAVFSRLAKLPFPSLAIISGPCLGGGLELALACDYRLVYDTPTTQLGLPEVQLGLLPGWGGTQRLPKIIGLERALQIILGQKRLSAREAFRWKLADAIAIGEQGLRQQFTALLGKAISRGKVSREKLPLNTWRQRFLESHPIGLRMIFRGTDRMLRQRIPDEMPAPYEALEAIKIGLKKGPTAGFTQERQAASRLAISPTCRNLIHLFLRGEAARKLPAELASPQPRPIRRVGIVGAGVMGAGIAQLAAFKGCAVVIQEANATALGSGMLRIKSLFDQAVERKLVTALEAEQRLALVRGTLQWEDFDKLDLVIEAAVENLPAKRDLFRLLEQFTSPETILASNTSFFKISDLQEGLAHPKRVTGYHCFNPVHKTSLVEVVGAPLTSRDTLAAITQWALSLGKTPVQVKDSPGFVINRILLPYLQEAVLLVQEGLKIRDVDAIMRRFGMLSGPLEVVDIMGLDVVAQGVETLKHLFDSRVSSGDALLLMKQNGWLGCKNGKGFYSHRGRTPQPNPLAENLLVSSLPKSSKNGLPKIARLNEARERLVLLMVNEGVKILSERIIADSATLDLAMILGTGWAPHRGGPVAYAKTRGTAEVIESLETLQSRHGDRFKPTPHLSQFLYEK